MGIVKSKSGKLVSKKASSAGKKAYKRIQGWTVAVQKAKKALGLKGFVAIKKGSALYKKAKECYGKGGRRIIHGSASLAAPHSWSFMVRHASMQGPYGVAHEGVRIGSLTGVVKRRSRFFSIGSQGLCW